MPDEMAADEATLVEAGLKVEGPVGPTLKQTTVEEPPVEVRVLAGSAGSSGTARLLLLVALAVQAVHFALHVLWARPTFASDMMQGLAALVSVAVCMYKFHRNREQRNLWAGLAGAFGIWVFAEVYYAIAILRPGATDVPLSDFLWLIYAFPLLVVTTYTPQKAQRAWAEWFDAAQAGIFFCILIALFFPPPGLITQAISDDVQGVALLLLVVLRYCIAQPGTDRLFFRNLTIYMVVYVAFCFLYYVATAHGYALGSVAELCWSLPFTFFSVMTLKTKFLEAAQEEERKKRGDATPAGYVQGASALGLAIMSLTGSAVLTYHRPVEGGVALAVAFLLFAARTSAREWQLRSVHSKLNHSVLHDPLTLLANRTLLDAEIKRRLRASAAGTSPPTCVMFLGLDRFKTLNDCLGHAFGDLLLRRVAELLSESIRKHDLVARYGGDEFVVLLDAGGAREAQTFAERTLAKLRTPMMLESRLLNVTASIGYTIGTADSTAAEMLQQAHFAMHHAKKFGRDRVQAFEEEMVRIPQFRLGLEADLRRALAADGMTVMYQPIFSVDSGVMEGFEALARWVDGERGNVSPADFIPVAEDTGLIIELGEQVLRKACRQCREWNQQFGTAYTMSVNVSAHQFASPNLLTQIVSVLCETGLEPRLLKLEITESVLISGYTGVEEVLKKAQKLGIQICLDDFGTGYSSLSYLLNYPFDVVKIDQSFVRHLDRDPQRADVVRTLVELAASLDKHLVAEGVERTEEMACLKEYGCEFVQGYLLSKPLSVTAATTLLELRKYNSADVVAGDSVTPAGVRRKSRAFLVDSGKAKVADPAA